MRINSKYSKVSGSIHMGGLSFFFSLFLAFIYPFTKMQIIKKKTCTMLLNFKKYLTEELLK